MKKTMVLLFTSTLIVNANAACNFENSEALAIEGFKMMNKQELAQYFCSSISGKRVYGNLAGSMKSVMPDLASSYARGASMCSTEIKRINLVLKKVHKISEQDIAHMSSIMSEAGSGDNIQRCQAVIIKQ